MTKAQFHYLLVCCFLLLGAAIISTIFATHGYSRELADVYEKEPSALNTLISDHLWLTGFSISALLLIALAGLAGLYRFKHWGRTISLYMTIVEFITIPFLGPSLSSPWESLFYGAEATLWGAILAVAYFSPLSAEFSNRHAAKK